MDTDFETRSSPHSLAATLCGFTFYLADPVSSIHRFEIKRKCARSASYLCFIRVHFICGSISRGLLLLSGVLGRKLDKHVFERRPHFVNLCMTDADFAQLFVDLGALDALIDQQMHRLAEYRRAAHSAHFVHGVQCRGHVIASYVEPARARWIYFWQSF